MSDAESDPLHSGLQFRSVLRSVRRRCRRVSDAIALAWCRPLVPTRHRQRTQPQTAAITASEPPVLVAARTVLYALAGGVIGWIATLTLALSSYRFAPSVVASLRAAIRTRLGIDAGGLSPVLFGVIVIAGSLLVGIGGGLGIYRLQWLRIKQRAIARGRRIDRTLPRAVAFMYALARSGMPLPEVLRTVAAHEAVYGETADAIGVTVREIDRFGVDVISALEATSDRTPATAFAEFTADLAAAVDSGRPIDDYLKTQHARYREAAADSHEGFLDRLSTAAEAYVTGLVVGPLFVVTALTVVGLVVTETIALLRVIAFGCLPVGTVGFLVCLNRLFANRRPPVETHGTRRPQHPTAPPGDGVGPQPTDTEREWCDQRATLRIADRLRGMRRWLRQPTAALAANPWLTLCVTLPLSVLWLAVAIEPPRLTPAALVGATQPLSIAIVGVCGTYAIAYEFGAARRRRLAAAVPAFLDRLAGVNEAGLSVVDGLSRVAAGDLGALSKPVARARRDVRWGADVASALTRLAQRVRSPPVTGAIVLVTNALTASNRIGPVAAIASAELRATRRLARRRRRAMAAYLIVIYVAFLVFLGIVVALSASFIPAIETVGGEPTGGMAAVGGVSPGIASAGTDNIAAYERLFAQIAAVQAVCSGLVAGRLGEGALRAGVKHIAVLVAIAQLVFWIS